MKDYWEHSLADRLLKFRGPQTEKDSELVQEIAKVLRDQNGIPDRGNNLDWWIIEARSALYVVQHHEGVKQRSLFTDIMFRASGYLLGAGSMMILLLTIVGWFDNSLFDYWWVGPVFLSITLADFYDVVVNKRKQ